MTAAIDVELLDEASRAAVERAIAAGGNTAPLMAGIAATLLGSVESVFAAEGLPRWEALSQLQRARRAAAGKWPGRMLQVSGRLAASIQPDSGERFALVATADRRARALHFGADQGEFGRSARGAPLPWGRIPPRPFMVLTEDARDEIVESALRWVAGEAPF